jgi:hypothetical protein
MFNPIRQFGYALTLATVSFASIPPVSAQDSVPTSTPMATLRTLHPRMIVVDSDIPAIKKVIASDTFAKAQFQALRSHSEELLHTVPNIYQLDSGHTLLTTARDVEDRILTLAGMYRLTGDTRYSDRAVQEMISAAGFPNWNPQHFLDTAELTTALGIGYDWLYQVLTPTQRHIIRQSVQTKGISPFLDQLHAKKVHYTNNWGQVCYGGETVGALAIAEQDDKTSMMQAEEIVSYARPGFASLMHVFAPDGGFDEGPVYWNYATIYSSLYLASLKSALGTDFGQGDAPGFSKTGAYRMQSLGPTLQLANFGDAEPSAFPAPQMFWFARQFNRPDYALYEKIVDQKLQGTVNRYAKLESLRFTILGLYWYALGFHSSQTVGLPLSQSFSAVGQGFMRLSWSDPGTWYVAFKGGDAFSSHRHLDLGSFVFDALSKRWGIDPGLDDYNLPDYFGAHRWDYYRTRTESHNTLTVGSQNEDVDGKASVSAIQERNNKTFSIISLQNAYKTQLRHWERGIAMLPGNGLLVQDEVSPAFPTDVIWHFHTYATIIMSSDNRTATLIQDGVSLRVRVLSPSMQFDRVIPQGHPSQRSIIGITDLVIRLPKLAKPSTISVLFSPSDRSPVIPSTPLGDW